MEPKGVALYYKGNSPKPLLYYRFPETYSNEKLPVDQVTFNCAQERGDGYAYRISVEYFVANSLVGEFSPARPKYNSTLSFLRLGIDGNVRVYTYDDKVDWGAWEMTFRLFDGDQYWEESQCHLPERCGSFGLCEDSQYVACPSTHGLSGWSKTCAPEKLLVIEAKSFHYCKLEGVDHFSSEYTRGSATNEVDCTW